MIASILIFVFSVVVILIAISILANIAVYTTAVVLYIVSAPFMLYELISSILSTGEYNKQLFEECKPTIIVVLFALAMLVVYVVA